MNAIAVRRGVHPAQAAFLALDPKGTVRWFKEHVLRSDTPPPVPMGKLRGVTAHHFGGFFRRQWRENDYLWGRLDGAERLLGLIDQRNPVFARQAFQAIVGDEKPRLKRASDLLRVAGDY